MHRQSFRRFSGIRKVITSVLILPFITSFIIPPQLASAQQIINPNNLNLPKLGAMVRPTDAYEPAQLLGIIAHPDNPLAFDFIVDQGEELLEGQAFNEEARRLIKYFLASLTTPEEEMWVNLSPYEGERVIPSNLGITEMGRDMLAQDYILKQLTASLMYPEEELGGEFWQRVRKRAMEKYGHADIPMNTYNKIWIVPKRATVYQSGASALILENELQVMIEEDYVALNANLDNKSFGFDQVDKEEAEEISGVTSEIIKEILIPEIEYEVNNGRHFAKLRQIANAMVLATWYKKNLKDTLLGYVYVDQNKTRGIDLDDKTAKDQIYDRYIQAFERGVYNYIKEEYDPREEQIILRKYFSGGLDWIDYDDRTSILVREQGATIPGRPVDTATDTVQNNDGRLRLVENIFQDTGPNADIDTINAIENLASRPLDVSQTGSTISLKPKITPFNVRRDAAVLATDKFRGLDRNIAESIQRTLVQGAAGLAGLATVVTRDDYEFQAKSQVPDLIRNRLVELFRANPQVATIYVDGQRTDFPDAEGALVVRATSLESPFNLSTGTANGTSFEVYQRDGQQLNVRLSGRIMWGTRQRVTLSDGTVTQDYQLTEDNQLVEVPKFRETGGNELRIKEEGSYYAFGGFSKNRPAGVQAFMRDVLPTLSGVKNRNAEAVTPDSYLIANKNGMMANWMTWGEAAGLAQIYEAAGAVTMVMTPQGMRNVSEIPMTEERLSGNEEVYVFAGSRETVGRVRQFLNARTDEYAQNSRPRPRQPRNGISDAVYRESFETYLSNEVNVPTAAKVSQVAASDLKGRAIAAATAVTEAFISPTPIEEGLLDDNQRQIVRELKEKYPDALTPDGEQLASLRDVLRGYRKNPDRPKIRNASGDMQHPLDFAFNNIINYVLRQNGITAIISEEDATIVRGMGQENLDSYRLVAFTDPIDGSSQIEDGGAFGSIIGIGFLKPNETLEAGEFNPRERFLLGFDLGYSTGTTIGMFNLANNEGRPEVVQFGLTRTEDDRLEFRREFTFQNLIDAEMAQPFVRESLVPAVNRERPEDSALHLALGGAFADSSPQYRIFMESLIDRYGMVPQYTGALQIDEKRLSTVPKVTRAAGVGYIYPTQYTRDRETQELKASKKLRLFFEGYYYAMKRRAMGAEVLDTDKVEPILNDRARGNSPSGAKASFMSGSSWMTKMYMSWNDYLERNTNRVPDVWRLSETELRDEFGRFLDDYIESSRRLIQDLVTLSREDGRQTKTPEQVRRALLTYDSVDKGRNYFPDLFRQTRESAYDRLFPNDRPGVEVVSDFVPTPLPRRDQAILADVTKTADVVGTEPVIVSRAVAQSLNRRKILDDFAEAGGISPQVTIENMVRIGMATRAEGADIYDFQLTDDFYADEKLAALRDAQVQSSQNPEATDLSVVRLQRILYSGINQMTLFDTLSNDTDTRQFVQNLERRDAFPLLTSAWVLDRAKEQVQLGRTGPQERLALRRLIDLSAPAAFRSASGIDVSFSTPSDLLVSSPLLKALEEYQRSYQSDIARGQFNYRGTGTRQTVGEYFRQDFQPNHYDRIRQYVAEQFDGGRNLKTIVSNGIGANDQFMWALVEMYNRNRGENDPVWRHVTTMRDLEGLDMDPATTLFIDISRSGSTWEGVQVANQTLAQGFNKRIVLANGGALKAISDQANAQQEGVSLQVGMQPDIGGRNMHRKTPIFYTAQTVVGMFVPEMDAPNFARLHDEFDQLNDFSNPRSIAVNAAKLLHGMIELKGTDHVTFISNTEQTRILGTELGQYFMEGANKDHVISFSEHDLSDQALEPPELLTALASSPAGERSFAIAVLDLASPSYAEENARVEALKPRMPVVRFVVDSREGPMEGLSLTQQAAFDIFTTDFITALTSLLRVDANSNPNVKVVRTLTADYVAQWEETARRYRTDPIGSGQTDLLFSFGRPGTEEQSSVGTPQKQTPINSQEDARAQGIALADQMFADEVARGRDRINFFAGTDQLDDFAKELRLAAYLSPLGTRYGYIAETGVYPLRAHKGHEATLAYRTPEEIAAGQTPLLANRSVNFFLNQRLLEGDQEFYNQTFQNVTGLDRYDNVNGANIHQTNDSMTFPNIQRAAQVAPTVLFEFERMTPAVERKLRAFNQAFLERMGELYQTRPDFALLADQARDQNTRADAARLAISRLADEAEDTLSALRELLQERFGRLASLFEGVRYEFTAEEIALMTVEIEGLLQDRLRTPGVGYVDVVVQAFELSSSRDDDGNFLVRPIEFVAFLSGTDSIPLTPVEVVETLRNSQLLSVRMIAAAAARGQLIVRADSYALAVRSPDNISAAEIRSIEQATMTRLRESEVSTLADILLTQDQLRQRYAVEEADELQQISAAAAEYNFALPGTPGSTLLVTNGEVLNLLIDEMNLVLMALNQDSVSRYAEIRRALDEATGGRTADVIRSGENYEMDVVELVRNLSTLTGSSVDNINLAFSIPSASDFLKHIANVSEVNRRAQEPAETVTVAAADAAVTAEVKPDTTGGIDLNPRMLDLQIKRDSEGVPLPVNQQPLENMNVTGFVPLIINVTPMTNLPLLFGMNESDQPPQQEFGLGTAASPEESAGIVIPQEAELGLLR